jgi:hypothetical protein
MSALELLAEVNAFGVEIRSNGTKLILDPAGKLPEELKERLREAKPELLATLRVKPTTCAPTCYEILPNVWLHHPWNGCTTRPGKSDAASTVLGVVADATCQHCGGIGKCACVTCAYGMPVGQEGDCAACARRGIRGVQ